MLLAFILFILLILLIVPLMALKLFDLLKNCQESYLFSTL